MKNFISNYHTHLELCGHAKGMSEDYVREAIDKGYQEIGISDHAPIPSYAMNESEHEGNWTFENMKEGTFYHTYLPDVKRTKEKYKKDIRVLIGLESEYLPYLDFFYRSLRKSVDYLICGIHYFSYDSKIINTYNGVDDGNVWGYAKTAVSAMKSGFFKILAHPDLFMFGKKTFSKECEEATRLIIQASIETGVYLEMNINGIRNSKMKKPYLYPNESFWKIVSEYKEVKVIISSDCHDPHMLYTEENEIVYQMAKDLGITITKKIPF